MESEGTDPPKLEIKGYHLRENENIIRNVRFRAFGSVKLTNVIPWNSFSIRSAATNMRGLVGRGMGKTLTPVVRDSSSEVERARE